MHQIADCPRPSNSRSGRRKSRFAIAAASYFMREHALPRAEAASDGERENTEMGIFSAKSTDQVCRPGPRDGEPDWLHDRPGGVVAPPCVRSLMWRSEAESAICLAYLLLPMPSDVRRARNAG